MDQVQEIYQDIFTDVQADISDSQVLVEKIIFSIAAIFVWYWLTRNLNRWYDRKIESAKVVNVVVNTSNYIFGFLFMMLFLV
ncbi:hypothetical protein, partial [Tetragenococcus koreensis]